MEYIRIAACIWCLSYADSGFFFGSTLLSWQDAQYDCLLRHMQLACPKNEYLYQRTKSYIEHNVSSLATGVWIGLHTTSSTSPFVYVWEDGEEATYFVWDLSGNEPTKQNKKQCIKLSGSDLAFGTGNCDKEKHYLCEDVVSNEGWSGWITWSECSVTCGNGTQSRNRSCNSNGGADCKGADKEDRLCNLQSCAVNGSWSMWSAWSECTPTQCVTNRTRSRSCDSPPPSHGGNDCQGKDQEEESCEHLVCPSEERLTCTQLSETSITSQELQEKIQEISKTLTVNKTSLSSEVRKKTCAEDPRPSSKYIGVIAVVFIGVYFGLLLLVDCTPLLRWACSKCKLHRN